MVSHLRAHKDGLGFGLWSQTFVQRTIYAFVLLPCYITCIERLIEGCCERVLDWNIGLKAAEPSIIVPLAISGQMFHTVCCSNTQVLLYISSVVLVYMLHDLQVYSILAVLQGKDNGELKTNCGFTMGVTSYSANNTLLQCMYMTA